MYHNTCTDPLGLCKTSEHDPFWTDDFSILYTNDNYLRFVPIYESSRNQQLNAITRFAIYAIILLLIFSKNYVWLIVPLIIILFVVVFKKIMNSDVLSREKELAKTINIRADKEHMVNELKNREYQSDGDQIIKTDIDTSPDALMANLSPYPDTPGTYRPVQEREVDYKVLAGYYDSDNTLHVGPLAGPSNYLRANPKTYYTVDEMIDFDQNTCRKPTEDNPFMNPPITDFGTPNSPVACNANDDDIKESIKVNFNKGLFQDVDELWDKTNAQRQFYTMPNTAIPNNQSEFANWLYKLPSSVICKDNQEGCLRYDDIRFRTR